MSINPRIVLAWLLSVALMAAYCPTPAFARGGGGGGGGGSHGGGGHISGGMSGGHSYGSVGSGNASHTQTPYMASRPIGPNQFQSRSFEGRNENWNSERHGDWNRGEFWSHREPDWDDWWRFGIGGPFYGYDWWPGYYRYYPYAQYGGMYDYGYDYGVAPYTAYEAPEVTEGSTPIAPEAPIAAGGETNGFYQDALAAFQEGDYSNASRLATHAVIEDPKNPDIHLLLSLGLFAAGQYRGAAAEAHAIAALGKVPDWPTVIGFYGNNVGPYTEQLRTLEKFVQNTPSAPEGRFLLGFQYMVAGHKDASQRQFMQALKLTPRDSLAAKLLTTEGGTVPADIAKQLAQPAIPPRRASTSGTGPSATK